MQSQNSHVKQEKEDGWVSRSFGCCVSNDEDYGWNHDNAQRSRDITYDQPQRVEQSMIAPAGARPSTSRSTGAKHLSEWYAASRKSLSEARRPWTSHSQKRPKIGAPTDFRHINEMPKRRHSFRPLELSIYMPGRSLSPLPDFDVGDWDMETLLKKPEPAVLSDAGEIENSRHGYSSSRASTGSFTIRRKPLSVNRGDSSTHQRVPSYESPSDIGTHHRFGSYASASTSILDEGFIPGAEYPLHDLSSDVASNVIESLPAVRHSDSRYARPRTPSSLSKSRSRSSTESSSSRKPSFRRPKQPDVDEAIRELNTIVEEKRLDAVRAASRNHSPRLSSKPNTPLLKTETGEVSPGLPSPHVPAIVPKMKVHARSETLSDIGSAFSTPLVGKQLPPTPSASIYPMTVSEESLKSPRPKLSLIPVTASRSVTAISPISPPTALSARSRISHWLRKSLTASLISPIEDNKGPDYMTESFNSHEREKAVSPFYKCDQSHPQAASYSSMTSTSTLSSFVPSPLVPSPTPSNNDVSSTTATALTSAASPSPLSQEWRPAPPTGKLPFAAHVKVREGKAAHVARARGLSVGTVTGVPPPPAYEEVDPHPNTPATPEDARIVGLAF